MVVDVNRRRLDRVVISEPDLLALSGCADLDELAALVDSNSDVDLWLTAMDDGLEVGGGVFSTVLAYPFFMAEFWEVVDEVERDQIRNWEADDEEASPPA
jgi:hypothetical protein